MATFFYVRWLFQLLTVSVLALPAHILKLEQLLTVSNRTTHKPSLPGNVAVE